jgi:hypothetical protein
VYWRRHQLSSLSNQQASRRHQPDGDAGSAGDNIVIGAKVIGPTEHTRHQLNEWLIASVVLCANDG